MNEKEAREKLSNFPIEYYGTGKKFVSMSPKAGSRVAVDSTIRLMLEN